MSRRLSRRVVLVQDDPAPGSEWHRVIASDLPGHGSDRTPLRHRHVAGPRIPTAVQRKLHDRDGITDVLTLETSHSSFLSRPDELARQPSDPAAKVPAARTASD